MKKIVLLLGLLTTFSIVQAQLLKKLKDKVDKTVDDATKGKKDEKGSGETNENTGVGSKAEPATMKTYSKYDFVPGEKIIVFEDFMQDKVGDFPDKWNTNSAGEVVTIEGKAGHWFKITQKGVFLPEFIDSLPENFTLEFDLLCDQLVGSWGLRTSLVEMEDRNKLDNWESDAKNYVEFHILPGGDGNGVSEIGRKKAGSLEATNSNPTKQFSDVTKPVHVAIWRQKERMRLYLNEEKAWDIPKAVSPDAKLNTLLFWVQLIDGDHHFLMSNIRLATGAPDTRNKILKESKWVTHGILFDVNSDKIKPESYGTLKEMADIMKEFTDLKVKIIGHTDADGNDAANLDLSKRRAAAVKVSLAKDFGIDESRMETDGKGESEPIDKNDTPAGKANNRRVEFIKL
jgi:outer membrane protein OmpA-like peptidoglycan-associated protein